MVKVRTSQIPEESSKPSFQKGEKKMKITRKQSYDFEDEEDVDDETEEEGESEKKHLSKTIIYFEDEGVSISAWDLHTIEKDMRFVEKPKAHWEFGITINKGLIPGQFINKTDLSLWYLTEEVRDEKLKNLMETLTKEGLNVIGIK